MTVSYKWLRGGERNFEGPCTPRQRFVFQTINWRSFGGMARRNTVAHRPNGISRYVKKNLPLEFLDEIPSRSPESTNGLRTGTVVFTTFRPPRSVGQVRSGRGWSGECQPRNPSTPVARPLLGRGALPAGGARRLFRGLVSGMAGERWRGA